MNDRPLDVVTFFERTRRVFVAGGSLPDLDAPEDSRIKVESPALAAPGPVEGKRKREKYPGRRDRAPGAAFPRPTCAADTNPTVVFAWQPLARLLSV